MLEKHGKVGGTKIYTEHYSSSLTNGTQKWTVSIV